MNRIYQGRVKKIELLDSKATSEKELPLNVLGEHHQLFQDAVNYYLVALAAMASDEISPLGKMRKRMKEEAWTDFERAGRRFDGLRRSLLRSGALGSNREISFDEAVSRINQNNPSSPEVLQLALDLLLSKVGGDAAIQQGGRGYWPRLCNPKANPTWDYSKENLQNNAGKNRLAALLHSEITDSQRDHLAKELDLSWTVKVQPGKFYTDSEAQERLKEALLYFQNAFKNPDQRLSGYLTSNPQAPHEIQSFGGKIAEFENLSFPRNRKAAPPLVFATLLFKFFPSTTTQALLALHVSKPKEQKEDPKTPDPFTKLGDDPIKLARGDRGYVFRAFTSLPIFGASDPEDIKWSEFDIAAFKEALKTVNQFRLKTDEREARRLKFLNAVAYMEGKTEKWADPEGAEDSDAPAKLKDDTRVSLAEKLIWDLKKDLELTDQDSNSITLSPRRLRGWSSLVEKFNRSVDPGEPFTDAKARKLKEILKKHQEEHRDDVGDVRLFEALIRKAEYWPLWQNPDSKEKALREEHDWSNKFLDDYRDYLEFKEEAEFLKEPIRFTPADALESRRLFMFSDLGGRSKVKHRSENLSVEVSVALLEGDDVWRERRLLLHYSAPRLRRDRLRGIDGSDDLTSAPWMQPMMESLGLPEPLPQDVAGHAVALMPEPGKEGMRFLLNFPINVEPANLIKLLGKETLWKGQFNGTRDKHIHLHWPQTMDEKHHENAWWKRELPFTCLAADLGTRACASVALMEFSPGEAGKNERLIGIAKGQPWKAKLLAKEQLKLAGEDMKVFEHGKMIQEPFGSKGRPADPHETMDFKRWLVLFNIKPDEYLYQDIEKLSFPEQNDRMLRIFRRAQGLNMQLNRWLRFLSEGDKAKIAEVRHEIKTESSESLTKWAESESIEPLKAALQKKIVDHQSVLKQEVVLLSNRILPLRDRHWEWVQRPNSENWILQQTAPGTSADKKKIRGQRGLSTMRIEQIEELRRRLQSLNRALQRNPGEKARMGRPSAGMEIPDPCPDIAAKLEALKEQRTNQTAHLILAHALGVKLKPHTIAEEERILRDIHGEYEIIPGRKPVDFIVLEDLSRYRTSQDRGPSENSRLMQWCHRAVTEKLIQLCEPYGIPVLETPAAYTSKFCSRTGIAGFRAKEITLGQVSRMGKKQKESREFEHLQKMYKELENAGRPDLPLLVPARGGPLFITMKDAGLSEPEELKEDADINAACNLALRAVAAPDAHQLLPRLRCRTEKGTLKFIGSIKNPKPSKRDEKRFDHTIIFTLKNASQNTTAEDDDQDSVRAANVFVDLGKVATYESAYAEGLNIPFSTGKGLWGTIKRDEFTYCNKLNAARIQKWRKEGKLSPEDKIEI